MFQVKRMFQRVGGVVVGRASRRKVERARAAGAPVLRQVRGGERVPGGLVVAGGGTRKPGPVAGGPEGAQPPADKRASAGAPGSSPGGEEDQVADDDRGERVAGLLDDLQQALDVRREGDAAVLAAVLAARAAGVSWAKVGAVLGMTGQGAGKRYG